LNAELVKRQCPEVDFVCRGDGEQLILDLLERPEDPTRSPTLSFSVTRISSASAVLGVAPGAGSITAFTCSSQSSSGIPKTAASPIFGCDSRQASISVG